MLVDTPLPSFGSMPLPYLAVSGDGTADWHKLFEANENIYEYLRCSSGTSFLLVLLIRFGSLDAAIALSLFGTLGIVTNGH